jgi:hypothetical protein
MCENKSTCQAREREGMTHGRMSDLIGNNQHILIHIQIHMKCKCTYYINYINIDTHAHQCVNVLSEASSQHTLLL